MPYNKELALEMCCLNTSRVTVDQSEECTSIRSKTNIQDTYLESQTTYINCCGKYLFESHRTHHCKLKASEKMLL